MNNFTFAIIVAALSASSAYAQPLALNGPLTAPAPFTKQARSLQSRAITKVAQRATRFGQKAQSVFETFVSVSAMLVYTCQKNIAQAFILERYFFVSICPAAIPGTCLSVFLAAVLPLC